MQPIMMSTLAVYLCALALAGYALAASEREAPSQGMQANAPPPSLPPLYLICISVVYDYSTDSPHSQIHVSKYLN